MRNKVKRLLRESYRIVEPNMKKGYNIVFLIKKETDISKICFKNIKEDMLFLIKKANLLDKI